MIGTAYIQVPNGRRQLRVAAFRRSHWPQIVRIGGAHLLSKMSTIYEFIKLELRPNHRQAGEGTIPAQNTDTYWLAVQAFSHGGSDWSQSAMRTNASLRVPEVVLAFDDCAPGIAWNGGAPESISITSVEGGKHPYHPMRYPRYSARDASPLSAENFV